MSELATRVGDYVFSQCGRGILKDEMEERHLPVPDTPVGWYRRGMQVLWVRAHQRFV